MLITMQIANYANSGWKWSVLIHNGSSCPGKGLADDGGLLDAHHGTLAKAG